MERRTPRAALGGFSLSEKCHPKASKTVDRMV